MMKYADLKVGGIYELTNTHYAGLKFIFVPEFEFNGKLACAVITNRRDKVVQDGVILTENMYQFEFKESELETVYRPEYYK